MTDPVAIVFRATLADTAGPVLGFGMPPTPALIPTIQAPTPIPTPTTTRAPTQTTGNGETKGTVSDVVVAGTSGVNVPTTKKMLLAKGKKLYY